MKFTLFVVMLFIWLTRADASVKTNLAPEEFVFGAKLGVTLTVKRLVRLVSLDERRAYLYEINAEEWLFGEKLYSSLALYFLSPCELVSGSRYVSVVARLPDGDEFKSVLSVVNGGVVVYPRVAKYSAILVSDVSSHELPHSVMCPDFSDIEKLMEPVGAVCPSVRSLKVGKYLQLKEYLKRMNVCKREEKVSVGRKRCQEPF